MKEFYYNRKMLLKWAVFSLVLLIFALCLPVCCLEALFFMSVVKLLALCFCLGLFYVYVNPQKLAQIDDEGIIIDHNAKLKWKDIEKVERFNKKGFCGRDFIRFNLKKNAKYHLRLAQKLSATSKYGAFSIPLYAMTKKDAAAIEKEIEKHLTLTSKLKNAVKRVFKVSSKKEMKQLKKAKKKK